MKVVMKRSKINRLRDCVEILKEEILFTGSKQDCQDWLEEKKRDLATIVPVVESGGYFIMDLYSSGIIAAVADRYHNELSIKYFIEE